jgi:hypothetical protein
VIERNGMSAVMDQRGGRPRRKRVAAQTLREICRLKREIYADFSMRHFYERLTEQHGVAVSYTYVRQVLQEARIVHKEPGRGRYRRRRERRPMVGMLVHLDASTHQWIAGQPTQDLVVALDDADGRILYAEFVAQEGTLSTFQALTSVVRDYGRFCELYTTAGLTSAALRKLAKHRLRSSRAKSPKPCALWASDTYWRARPKPAGAVNVPSRLFRAGCRRNCGCTALPAMPRLMAT